MSDETPALRFRSAALLVAALVFLFIAWYRGERLGTFDMLSIITLWVKILTSKDWP